MIYILSFICEPRRFTLMLTRESTATQSSTGETQTHMFNSLLTHVLRYRFPSFYLTQDTQCMYSRAGQY